MGELFPVIRKPKYQKYDLISSPVIFKTTNIFESQKLTEAILSGELKRNPINYRLKNTADRRLELKDLLH